MNNWLKFCCSTVGGSRANCHKFIGWVTGCGQSTICSVAEQMRVTGGDREPPEHGLRKYYQKLHPHRRRNSEEEQEDRTDSTGLVKHSDLTNKLLNLNLNPHRHLHAGFIYSIFSVALFRCQVEFFTLEYTSETINIAMYICFED